MVKDHNKEQDIARTKSEKFSILLKKKKKQEKKLIILSNKNILSYF